METQSSFDLNLAIQRWRENLARSAALRAENLNELESHLRDSIETLRKRELSDEEIFFIATRRIGNAQKLEHEFGKVNSAAIWFDRCLWVLLAAQLWAMISSGSGFLLGVIAPLCLWLNELLPGFGLEKISVDWLQTALALTFSPLFTAVLAALVWRFFIWPKRRGSALLQKLLRQPVYLALTLFLLCVIVQIAAAWALQTWYYPTVFHGSYNQGWQMRTFLFRLPTLVFWAGLTYFLARKRLRSALA
jgi:hypothetical protein